MTMDSMAKLENDLRLASEQRRYGAVGRLALEFGEAARRVIGSLEPGDPAAARIAQQVLCALESSRLLALSGRAMIADELRSIPIRKRYLVKSPPRPSIVRLDG
jgi:hypothetical protein